LTRIDLRASDFSALAESNNAPIRAEIIKRANVLCVLAHPGVAPLAKSTPRATPSATAPAADQTALQRSENERLPIHTKALNTHANRGLLKLGCFSELPHNSE
jgi:hypothetical protein